MFRFIKGTLFGLVFPLNVTYCVNLQENQLFSVIKLKEVNFTHFRVNYFLFFFRFYSHISSQMAQFMVAQKLYPLYTLTY